MKWNGVDLEHIEYPKYLNCNFRQAIELQTAHTEHSDEGSMLHTVNNTVAKGLNQMAPPARTITVALDMSKYIQPYLHKDVAWTKQNNIIQIQTKKTCTLLIPDPAEYKNNLDLKINNTALPMATHPKVLDLTLDPKLTYSTHIHNISVQAHKLLQMMKTLTATGWGKHNETLMATYKAVMRRLWSMPLPYGRLLHPQPALTICKSCTIQH